MSWADPDFAYDHLAITRNFVGSPHVDREDTSFQYALALGDYGQGGELVVESEDGRTRWVVDTRGKIARVDGRFVHWVRGYSRSRTSGGPCRVDGTRYSVIYYMNRPQRGTERTFAVDESWTPAGRRGAGTAGRGRGGALIAACAAAVCGLLMAARKLRYTTGARCQLGRTIPSERCTETPGYSPAQHGRRVL